MRDSRNDDFKSSDLPDQEEVEKLNMEFGLVETGEKAAEKNYLPVKIGAVAVVIVFLFFALNSVFTYLTWPSLGFIHESRELEKDPYLKELQEAVVQVIALKERVPVEVRGSGTGFNLSSKGVILTNRHVVEDAEEIVVNFEDKGSRRVQEWYLPDDKNLDMALLILEDEGLPFLKIDKDASPDSGNEVFVVGNPLGFSGIISEGKIQHSLNGGDFTIPLITIEAEIHPGSSGSPVFNKEREVIGIVYATATIEDEDAPLGLALSLENMEDITFNGDLGDKNLTDFW